MGKPISLALLGETNQMGASTFGIPTETYTCLTKPQAGREDIEGRVVADWEEEIGNLYVQGARELDFDRRKEIYDQTQQLAMEYLPLIYLVNPYSLSAVRNRIEGVEYSPLGGAFWNIEKLTIADE